MISSLKEYILNHSLFVFNDKILLGVSGGVDSVVMTDLFLKLGLKIGIAHCNFQLRGAEADGDEQFVSDLASDNNVPFYIKRFDTTTYAKENHISVQMAARNLRFAWFSEICKQNNYQCVALAHNLNDGVETFFINLLRGTGIKGLTGIKPRNGIIVHPLLYATREEIIQYAGNNNIRYREDSSNASLKYKRNQLRHLIIPELQQLEPNFVSIMNDNMNRIRAAMDIYQDKIDEYYGQIVEVNEREIKIDIDGLLDCEYTETIAYEILTKYGFSHSTIQDIIENLDGTSGKIFYSKSYRLIKGRQFLFIMFREHDDENKYIRYYIDEADEKITQPVELKIEKIKRHDGFTIEKSPDHLFIDLDKVEFPLIIRKWHKGDYFKPLGMSGLKKLSDYFIDNKYSIPAKENTWILTSGEKIIWIIGARMDDRYKIRDNTVNILHIQLCK